MGRSRQRHLKVEQERADIQVARANYRNVIIDTDVLGVQQDRRFVLVELHPSPEQILVVRTLGVTDKELVGAAEFISVTCTPAGPHW